jgi:hypothetical protein
MKIAAQCLEAGLGSAEGRYRCGGGYRAEVPRLTQREIDSIKTLQLIPHTTSPYTIPTQATRSPGQHRLMADWDRHPPVYSTFLLYLSRGKARCNEVEGPDKPQFPDLQNRQ